MKAFIFPGQGAQFPGMGKPLYDRSEEAKKYFDKADEILGSRISETMFHGSKEELKKTHITQPAIFLHSTILFLTRGFKADMVAGHSLGEFSALVANKGLSFEDGLALVNKRARAMQKACEAEPSTMAAILGLDDAVVKETCEAIDEVIVPANYNSPGQVVISGSEKGVSEACEKLKEKGAKRAMPLQVHGAFHSPLMEPARVELEKAIRETPVNEVSCPIYQNATAEGTRDPETIRENLIAQLTAPVKWTQSVENMIADGATSFTEVGPGKVLQGLVTKIDRNVETAAIQE